MIYKNIEIFNVAEIYDCPGGGISWMRVPKNVYETLECGDQARNMAKNSTGVELRFVIKSGDGVVIRMAKLEPSNTTNVFHVYRGGIQGTWEDCEVDKYVFDEPKDYFIKKSDNIETLKKMAAAYSDPWDPDVVRVIFDRGAYRILDVVGDVEPPKGNQLPANSILFYGSSITHGSNSIDMSHSWASIVGRNLRCDVINKGFAGSCAMEPEMIDYISKLGKDNKWDVCVMELGINVLWWEEEKVYSRAENAVKTMALSNPEKKIFVISPFYCYDDFKGGKDAEKWRTALKKITDSLRLPNVTYINGPDLLSGPAGLSADEVHPNIYGVQSIANGLTAIIKKIYKNS